MRGDELLKPSGLSNSATCIAGTFVAQGRQSVQNLQSSSAKGGVPPHFPKPPGPYAEWVSGHIRFKAWRLHAALTKSGSRTMCACCFFTFHSRASGLLCLSRVRYALTHSMTKIQRSVT